MAEAAPPHERPPPSIAVARAAIGLFQGVALYLLSEAAHSHAWPATAPALFAAATLVLAFVPLIVIGAVGRIRPAPLAAWTALAGAALAAFGWHDIDAGIWSGLYDPSRLALAAQVWLFSAVFVFVGHHLVGPADEARRLAAPYRSYFDWAWKDGVQVLLSAAFVGVLWLALKLGGELFTLIGIPAVARVIEQRWFAFPASFLAFAVAVQLTDVRVGLIRGVRTVGLTLLSWLLPLMTAIVVAFLAALPFTGLTPLFGTRSGAATVLAASAALIVLVSAAYQDGQAKAPLVLRYAGRAAGLALVPLILIAADALALRIGQYGLSPQRIEAIACTLVGAGFAAGYALAALRRKGPWMRPLEPTNVIMARVVSLLVLAMLTPLADPARLAVDDQVGRLTAGQTPPEKFDFKFLQFRAGRYGAQALARLERLAGTPRNLAIANLAKQTTALQYPGVSPPLPPAERFNVYPAGAALPAGFAAQAAKMPLQADAAIYLNDYLPCLGDAAVGPCDAYVADIDGTGRPAVLLGVQTSGADFTTLRIFKASPTGAWTDVGRLVVRCPDAIAALRAGRLRLVPHVGRDVELAGRRQAMLLPDAAPCPAP